MSKELSAHSLDDLVRSELLGQSSPALEQVAETFNIAITPAMMDLIDRDDPSDPIAAQFIPSVHELELLPGERADPIGDDKFTPTEGLIHRYPDRVLLKPVSTCAVYCRFCFRREKVGGSQKLLSSEALESAFAYIEGHREIWEVILSGGDPLILSDRRIAEMMARLNAIPQVKVIRLHSRLPVVDPERITPSLVASLKGSAPVYILVHCNHPRELTPLARAACARLVDAGIPLLSQSVLLRGINDDRSTLEALMRAFVETRIKPHYLHHGDLARGTAHFRTSIEAGQKLLQNLRGHLSGLCQPTYILDIPGGFGKAPIGAPFIRKNGAKWTVEDYTGERHTYEDLCPDSVVTSSSEKT